MKNLFLSLFLIMFVGCSSNEEVAPDASYTKVSIKDLVDSPDDYRHSNIMLEAYVLGAEFDPSEGGAQLFILSLGEELQCDDRKANQIFFPGVKYKVRAAEDGYNSEIIKSCYIMADNARKLGSKLTVFGTFNPDQPFYYYGNGIDIEIQKIRVGTKTVNSDFDDKSKFAHETPGMLKKMYQGGKKLIDFAGKITP
ncbi:MAG: hypothetical protein MK132_19730 [Lentisphaerales bacterium]|nr:hypothetical protein [Lentisphaerales bacterium]